MTSAPSQSRRSDDFRVAVICALPLEADMVKAVFDDVWSDNGYGLGFRQAREDRNAYTIGLIGKHNVVLVHMAGMGATDATNALSGLRETFPNIDVVFLVGICGASPINVRTQKEIYLGDCILSTAVIQYDFGRQYPGHYERKNDIEDSLGRAKPEIRNLLAMLQTHSTLQALEGRVTHHLQVLQKREPKGRYPGVHRDHLFDSAYLHMHRNTIGRCNKCIHESEVCTADCDEIGCEEARLITRSSPTMHQTTSDQRLPRLHFGRYGSANTVLKSGLDRDKYIKDDKIIAFEMEAAGIWEGLATLVVKSACDYADSHKNKEWQDYAAATAAVSLKSVLEYWRLVDDSSKLYLAVQAADADLSTSESIDEGDRLVRNHYRSGGRLLIKRLSGQELELEKCYINLALIDKSNQAGKNKQTSFSLRARLRLDAFDVGQSVALETLFNSRKLANRKTINPRRILIQGRAGIGKTTLCKKIVHEFLEERFGSKLFDRLIWVSLRGLRSNQQQYDWRELLCDTFKTKSRAWEGVRDVYEKQFDNPGFLTRTLFLFDGLDEISYRWRDDDPMCEFINKVMRDIPNSVITSRPQASLLGLEQFDLDLETIGFTLDQIAIYMENCIKTSEKVVSMKNWIANKPLIRGLLRIPIQLDAFCYTWHKETNLSECDPPRAVEQTSDMLRTNSSVTMTTLYQSIVTELCMKDLRRMGKLQQHQRLFSSEMERQLKRELVLLEEVAFQALFNGIAELNPQHWDKLGRYLDTTISGLSTIYPHTLDELSFVRTSDHDSDSTKRTYHFIHLTFQEFFAARHFARSWQHNKTLTLLRLTQRDESIDRTPLQFLQEEKYNPRYNIFWRFVAGLLYEKHDVITFFQRLHDEPKDWIGAIHLRLTMYCLNEVPSYVGSDLQEWHALERDRLRQGLIQEYRNTGRAELGEEAEFCEDILIDLLNTDTEIPYLETLSVLRKRSVLQKGTVEAVTCKLNSSYTFRVRLEAAKILWNNLTVCPPPVLQRVIDVIFAAVKNGSSQVIVSITSATMEQSSLPEAAVNVLVNAVLNNQNPDVRKHAAYALERQSFLPETIVNALVNAVRNDEDPGVREHAASALRGRSSLPETTVNALVNAVLTDKNPGMLEYAANALAAQSSLPDPVFRVLVNAVLNDKDLGVRKHATYALAAQSSLPDTIVNALVNAVLNDKDPGMQGYAAHTLAAQSSLPEATIDALIAALKDKDSHVRWLAAFALGSQSSPPEAAINAFIAALADKDRSVRLAAVNTLRRQSSLSKVATDALIKALKDEYCYVQWSAASALTGQSALSETAIDALIALHKDEDLEVRKSAARALGGQTSLSETAIDALTAALADKNPNVRSTALIALGERSPQSEAIIRPLIAALKEETSLWKSVRGPTPVLTEFSRELLFNLHKCPVFFTMIRNLDTETWKYIWLHWLEQSTYKEISCYEVAGNLYIWSAGFRYKILTDAVQVDQFRRVALGTSDIVSDVFVASKPCIAPEQDNDPTTKICTNPEMKPLVRCKIPLRKKLLHKVEHIASIFH